MIGSDKVDINSQSCIDVSSMIANLEDIKISYNRVDYNGVVRKCGSTIEFVGKAREALIENYKENRLKSSGAFAVYSMTETWTFEPIFECPLDFSTFNYDSYVAKIGCVDNSVAAKLKANNNTKYEIAVSSVKSVKQLKFDALRLVSFANFVFMGTSVEGESYTTSTSPNNGNVYYMPPMGYSESESFYNSSVVFYDQEEGWSGQLDTSGTSWNHGPNVNTTSFFLEAAADVDIEIDLKSLNIKVVNSELGDIDWFVQIWKIPVSGNPTVAFGGTIKSTVHLKEGEKLQLVLSRLYPDLGNHFGKSTFYFYSLGSAEWISSGEPVMLDIVKPVVLLNGILDKIGLSSSARGEIVPDNSEWFDSLFILAGETIRDFPEAVIYTSFSDFCKAMETLAGLVYEIVEDALDEGKFVVRFVPRSSVFTDMRLLKLDAIGEPTYSVTSESIYSNINIGYEKQDYDLGNNGKDEFNFNIHYSTGLSLKDQTLDFMCPYRADSYGMQELMQKREETVSDTDSDNSTFVVYVTEQADEYVLNRSKSVTGVFLDTVFNAALSPFAILENNRNYLASYTDRLTYASSEILKSITIDGNAITDTQILSAPLFLPGTIRVKTNYMKLPENWNGYVEFAWDGQTYKGYVKSVDMSFFHEEVLEYELIEC